MRARGPRPVVKIRHVKSSRVDPRVSRATRELARMVASRMRHNTTRRVVQLWIVYFPQNTRLSGRTNYSSRAAVVRADTAHYTSRSLSPATGACHAYLTYYHSKCATEFRPRPVVKIRRVKSSRLDPRVECVTGKTARMPHNTGRGVVRLCGSTPHTNIRSDTTDLTLSVLHLDLSFTSWHG